MFRSSGLRSIVCVVVFFLMIRRPPRSTQSRSSAASDVYKRQLEVCVLAVIRNKPSYGYQIIKDMKPYVEISESTLYTILKRLEDYEMLTVKTVEHNSRLRKYYHITNQGLKRIEEYKRYWPDMVAMYQFIVREENKQ